jgi:hypothetical protein
MTNASSIPGTATKIDDLFGSALEIATVIQMAWPNRLRCRKPLSPLRPRCVLAQVRGLLHPRAPGPMDRVSASGIVHLRWKAICCAAWPSGIVNSTPSSAFSARPWVSFWLAPDGFDPGAHSTPPPPPSFTSSVPCPASLVDRSRYRHGFSLSTAE